MTQTRSLDVRKWNYTTVASAPYLHKQADCGRFASSGARSCAERPCFWGGMLSAPPIGKDVSAAVILHPAVTAPVTKSERVHPPVKSAEAHSHPIPSHPPTISAAAGPVSTSPSLPATLSHGPHLVLHRRHVLSVKQFSQRDTYDLFPPAHEMRLQVERNGRCKAPS